MFIERRDKENNLFRELQTSSLEMIQERSGDIWTDYNDHDPGITILDHLHYALFEMNYTHSLPFIDYLKDKTDPGKVDFPALGLFSPNELLAPSIVTPSDYEELICNTIEEVTGCRIILDQNHRYTIQVKVKEDSDQFRLQEQIETLYHSHRNLCETLGRVQFVADLVEKETDCLSAECPVYDAKEKQFQPRQIDWISYSSIQNDFPDNYGINKKGKPPGITPEHEARIMQLKGYLLLFDYLMGNNYHQINNIPELLSFSETIPTEPVSDIEIDGIKELIDQEKKGHTPLQNEKWLHRQKTSYLDMLDSLYGENTDKLFPQSQDNDLPRKNKKRVELIRLFPELNTNRFRSFNILDPSAESIPSVKKMIAAILDYDLYAETSITNLFSRYNLRLLSDEQFFSQYNTLLNIEFLFEDLERNGLGPQPERIEKNDQPYNERRFWHFRRQLNLLWHHVLFESFLKYGSNPEYYRMIWQEDRNGYLLLYKHPGMHRWLNMGFFFEKQTLINVVNDLWKFIHQLNQYSCSFYLVEHILLSTEEENTGTPADIHTLSIVIPAWNERYNQREMYETLLLEKLPAHVTIQFLWVNAEEMYRFEQLYFAWRKVLPHRDNDKTAPYARALYGFINDLHLSTEIV